MIRFVAGKLLHVDTVTRKVTDRSGPGCSKVGLRYPPDKSLSSG